MADLAPYAILKRPCGCVFDNTDVAYDDEYEWIPDVEMNVTVGGDGGTLCEFICANCGEVFKTSTILAIDLDQTTFNFGKKFNDYTSRCVQG